MSQLMELYCNLKLRYPKHVIWFKMDQAYQCYSECAIITANQIGTILTKTTDNDPLTGFSEKQYNKYLEQMIKSGNKVVVAELNM